mgnify:CR=1 FL=1
MLDELAVMKEPFDKLWTNAVHFHNQYEKWMSGPLLLVNAEEVEEEVIDLTHHRLDLDIDLILLLPASTHPAPDCYRICSHTTAGAESLAHGVQAD